MHNIKSILIGLFLGIIILLAIAVSVSLIYEDEVSQYLIEELNEYVSSEVEIEEVNFSLIKKFPKASLEFKNVRAFSKEGYFKEICGFKTDTLFNAKSLFIELNILDIITKNYTIKSIHLDNGSVNLFIDRFGDPNYIFWNQNPENESEEFTLKLEQVKLTNSEVLFCNEATSFIVSTHAKKVNFQGNFSNQNYLMKIKSDIFIKSLEIDKIKYLNDNSLISDIELDIINKKLIFNSGNLKLNGLVFNLSGEYDVSDNKKDINLLITGGGLSLRSFIKTLPNTIKDEFPNIIVQKGNVNLNFTVKGKNINKNNPHIEIDYLINNAQLFDEKRNIRLQKITINGQFTNGDQNCALSSKLIFKEFEANLENSYVNGSFKIHNLKDPNIKLDLNTDIILDELHAIVKIDTLEILQGRAKAKVFYNGSYQELRSFKFQDLFTKEYELNISIKEGKVKLVKNPILISDLSGSVELKKSLYADSIYFRINENDFLLNGRISKLFEYFNEKEIFNVNAKLESNRIDLNELAPLFKVDKTQENNSSYKFPEKLALQLRLDIKDFNVGKFSASNISGNLNYKPKMFSLHQISFNSMDGNIKAGGVIIQKYTNDFTVRTQSKLNNIDINKLFYSFNDFGQKFIINENLEGNLSGDLYFNSEWSDKLKVHKNTVKTDCDITLTDGELNNFEPMQALSRFIDVDELKNIKFSTLRNQITIENEKIIIPQMNIESSVINVTASGEHNFDNTYEYHLKLLLSDLLSGKFKRSKRKKKDENIEEDNTGRITLYLLLKGDEDDFKVRYDRKQAKTERKKSMNNEKNELKQLLNQELGLYKNDSIIKSQEKKEENFKVEFEDVRINNEKEKEKAEEQKFEIEWEENDTTNNG